MTRYFLVQSKGPGEGLCSGELAVLHYDAFHFIRLSLEAQNFLPLCSRLSNGLIKFLVCFTYPQNHMKDRVCNLIQIKL